MKNKPVLLHVSVLVGLGVYLVLFYATRLPSLELVPGSVFRRAALFLYLLEPEYLVLPWFVMAFCIMIFWFVVFYVFLQAVSLLNDKVLKFLHR